MTAPNPTERAAAAQDDDWQAAAGVGRSKAALPVFLVLGLTLAAAVAWYFFLRAPDLQPNKVLVAVQTQDMDGEVGIWWGARARPSARFVDQLNKEFEKSGLEFVDPASPEVLDALKAVATDDASLQAAAASMGAAYTLAGTLELVGMQTLEPGTLSDYTAIVALRVLPSDPAETAVALTGSRERFHAVAEDGEKALLQMAAELPRVLFSPISHAFIQMPSLARLDVDPAQLATADLALAGKVERLFHAGKLWANQLTMRQEEEARERTAEEETERGLSRERVGELLDEEYFVGPTHDSRIVVMTEPHYLQLLPGQGAYDLSRGHEQLQLVNPDTKERTTLLEVYNIFSYPDVSEDGKTVAAVLDRRQYSKALVTVSVETGELKELAVEPDEYFSSPEISANGKRVAVWHRERRRAPSELLVFDVAGGEPTVVWPADSEQSLSVPSWTPDENSLYFSVTPSGELASIWRVDVASPEPKAVLGPAADGVPSGSDEAEPDDDSDDIGANEGDDEAGGGDEGDDAAGDDGEGEDDMPAAPAEASRQGFDRPTVSPDGTKLAVFEYGGAGRYIGLFDIASGSYERIWEGRAQWLRWSPDGTRIAFESWRTDFPDDPRDRDTEVVVLDVAKRSIVPVTVNAEDDSVMGWSRDGKRVFFHQGSRDPDGDRWTNRIYWATP